MEQNLFDALFADNFEFLDFEEASYTHFVAVSNILHPLPKQGHKGGEYWLNLIKTRYYDNIIKKYGGNHIDMNLVKNTKNLFKVLPQKLVSSIFNMIHWCS